MSPRPLSPLLTTGSWKRVPPATVALIVDFLKSGSDTRGFSRLSPQPSHFTSALDGPSSAFAHFDAEDCLIFKQEDRIALADKASLEHGAIESHSTVELADDAREYSALLLQSVRVESSHCNDPAIAPHG
jgi:hypothetical protein